MNSLPAFACQDCPMGGMIGLEHESSRKDRKEKGQDLCFLP